MVCGVGEFGVGNPDLGNPAVGGGKGGEEEAARGGTRLVRVVRWTSVLLGARMAQTHPTQKMESTFFRRAQRVLEIANGGSNESL
jgi:hypothetical protein